MTAPSTEELKAQMGWLIDQVNASMPPAGQVAPDDPLLRDLLWQWLADADHIECLHAAAWLSSMNSDLIQVREERDRLREVTDRLIGWTEHDAGCATIYPRFGAGQCDCGLTDIINETRRPQRNRS